MMLVTGALITTLSSAPGAWRQDGYDVVGIFDYAGLAKLEARLSH
ncbi:MAG: hypothetical protein AB7V46_14095 [Thermomicrobiales bacterium]